MTKVVETKCALCKPFCGISVYVNNGKIEKIEADADDPMGHGLCPRPLAAKQLVYHPDRLTHPLQKDGNTWKKISWNEALDTITTRMNRIRKRYGNEAVAVIHGTERGFTGYVTRFANSIGTPNRCEPGGATCFFPRLEASKYTFGQIAYYLFEFEPEYTNCMLIWGMNNLVAAHLTSRKAIIEAKEKGAKLIVVDPVFTSLAAKADLWLQIRPGSDDALALAMINVIIEDGLYDKNFVRSWTIGFEKLKNHVKSYTPEWAERITWIPSRVIREAARTYATNKPAVLDVGVAIEQQINSFQTARMIAIMIALTGNLDVPGGNPIYDPMGPVMPLISSQFQLRDELPKNVKDKRLGAEKYRILCYDSCQCHFPTLLDAVLTGNPYPVKGAMVFGSNALLSFPNSNKVYKCLKKLEFLVVTDLFMTPTAELADILLPAATFLERDNVENYYGQALYLVPLPKVIEPIGECWDDKKIILQLGKRLGDEKYWPWREVTDILDYILEPVGMTYKKLKEKGYFKVERVYRKFEKRGFKTPSGKVELYSERLEKMGYDPMPFYRDKPEMPSGDPDLKDEYPLVLITGGRSPLYTHTEMRNIPWLREIEPEPYVEIHPSTAKKLHIKENETVSVVSPRGRIKMRAHYTLALDQRVVHVPYRWWYPEKAPPNYGWKESNVNILTSSDPPFDDAMGSWPSRCLFCKVEKLGVGTKYRP